jgi:uncharacterized Zn-finger protein
MTQASSSTENQQAIMLTGDHLPLHCPGPKAPLWSMHPRVFLDVTKTGMAKCPYCSTEYRLVPGAVVHAH